MKSLTLAYITARHQPEFEWFLDSLEIVAKEAKWPKDQLRVVIVDSLRNKRTRMPQSPFQIQHVLPKPTVWQGKHRVTKDDWWAVSNARNTAICLCQTDWIAFADDRSVLQPGWFVPVKQAMKENYIVAGTYEKRSGMTVAGGYIKHGGIVTAPDGRETHRVDLGLPNPTPCGGEWLFGCTFAMPLEWALAVNGVEENCDGSSGEDTMFGRHLQNAGYPIKFDNRMKIVEDRTEGFSSPIMARKDKFRGDPDAKPRDDKSHAIVNLYAGRNRASHPFDIREERARVLKGYGFSAPWGPKEDFWDNQPISEMTPP